MLALYCLCAEIGRDGSFKAGDVIVAVDGKAIDAVGKLFARLDDYQVGQTVKLTVLRDGGRVELPVTLQPGN